MKLHEEEPLSPAASSQGVSEVPPSQFWGNGADHKTEPRRGFLQVLQSALNGLDVQPHLLELLPDGSMGDKTVRQAEPGDLEP